MRLKSRSQIHLSYQSRCLTRADETQVSDSEQSQATEAIDKLERRAAKASPSMTVSMSPRKQECS